MFFKKKMEDGSWGYTFTPAAGAIFRKQLVNVSVA